VIIKRFQTQFFGDYVTMLLFGVTAFLAAAITMTLPESKNVKLPDTIDEAENVGTRLPTENNVNAA